MIQLLFIGFIEPNEANALSCAPPKFEVYRLQLQSVTEDGNTLSDLSAYDGVFELQIAEEIMTAAKSDSPPSSSYLKPVSVVGLP